MREVEWLGVGCLVVLLYACGSDPRDPPGCPVGMRRCADEVIQICTSDARTRSARWFDVVDCSETDEVCVMTGDEDDPAWPYCDVAESPADAADAPEDFE